MITSAEAAEKFIERIIIAYREVIDFYESNLQEGLTGRVDDPIEMAIN